MRPELEEMARQIRELNQTCLDEDELSAKLEELGKSPLFWELAIARANSKKLRESFRRNLDRYFQGLGDDPKPNFAVQIMGFIEDMAQAYGVSPKDNLTWQTAQKTEAAYQRILEARRTLAAAQRRLGNAESEYEDLLSRMGLEMEYRGLEPFSGTPYDPLTWFLTLDEVVERARTELHWEVTPSQIRYYARLGLLNKPVRVGQGGRAVYPATVLLRLGFIQVAQRDGTSLAALQQGVLERAMSDLVRDKAKDRTHIFHRFARLTNPRTEEMVRLLMRKYEEETERKAGR